MDEDTPKFLKALLLLEIQKAQQQENIPKLELLLYRAGFSNKEIADILQKKEGSVAVAVHRAKGKENK